MDTLLCRVDCSQTALGIHHNFYASHIKRRPHIYIMVALTMIIFLPWMAMHKMPIKAEVLLNSVVLLQFEGYIRCGLFGCISQKPFSENHVFGIMSKALGHQPEKGILDNFMLSEFQKILPKMIFHSFCAPDQSQVFILDFDILHHY